MLKIRIIHIDDEVETINYCKSVFLKHENIDYLMGFTDADGAVNFLNNNKVDLIFCDIEMPNHNGIWLANNLPYTIPLVFITAHTGFAIEAFDACALHYLLKPLSSEQIDIAIDRFKTQQLTLQQPHQNVLTEQLNQLYNFYLPQDKKAPPTRIFINNIGKIIIVNLESLMYLEGAGNYTKFFMHNKECYTSSKNLKVYDDAIKNNTDYVRIHRSYIVNKSFVKQIVKANNNQWYIEMLDEQRLEISKGRLDEILELLQN